MSILERTDFKKWIQDPKNKILVIVMFFTLLILVVIQSTSSPHQSTETELESTDTLIPDGFVLVPIEIQNIDSLSSLIGPYAIVDLYSGAPGGKQQRVGQRLRLLRAPLNPQQFAVLTPEHQVSNLMATPGPFWAVIQNPQQKKNASIRQKKTPSNIEYFGD